MVYSLAILCHRNYMQKQFRVFILKTGEVSKAIQPFSVSPIPGTKMQVPAEAVGNFPVTLPFSRIISSLHFNKPLCCTMFRHLVRGDQAGMDILLCTISDSSYSRNDHCLDRLGRF